MVENKFVDSPAYIGRLYKFGQWDNGNWLETIKSKI